MGMKELKGVFTWGQFISSSLKQNYGKHTNFGSPFVPRSPMWKNITEKLAWVNVCTELWHHRSKGQGRGWGWQGWAGLPSPDWLRPRGCHLRAAQKCQLCSLSKVSSGKPSPGLSPLGPPGKLMCERQAFLLVFLMFCLWNLASCLFVIFVYHK